MVFFNYERERKLQLNHTSKSKNKWKYRRHNLGGHTHKIKQKFQKQKQKQKNAFNFPYQSIKQGGELTSVSKYYGATLLLLFRTVLFPFCVCAALPFFLRMCCSSSSPFFCFLCAILPFCFYTMLFLNLMGSQREPNRSHNIFLFYFFFFFYFLFFSCCFFFFSIFSFFSFNVFFLSFFFNIPFFSLTTTTTTTTYRPYYVQVQSKSSFPPYGLPPNYIPPTAVYALVRISVISHPYSLRVNNLNPIILMPMSLNPWGKHMKLPKTTL